MFFRASATPLVLALASLCATATQAKTDIASGLYIVEFHDVPSASAKTLYQGLTESAVIHTPRLTLKHELFSGVSIVLHGESDSDESLSIIKSMDIVKSVWPQRLHTKLPSGDISVGKNLEANLQKRAGTTDSYAPHVLTGVDQLHNERIYGRDVFIGIIDTGVDYTHEALGGAFGPGNKVVAGYDLVGDAFDGTNTPNPGPDPMDCHGQGTVISGIVGALSNPYGFIGVAPNATLGMWKVFGCEGSTTDDILLQAFHMAYDAGVDIISSSTLDLGGSNPLQSTSAGSDGWVGSPLDAVITSIVQKGVPCIVATGLYGGGPAQLWSPSEAIGATAVAAVDNPVLPRFLVDSSYHYVNGSNSSSISFTYAPGSNATFSNLSLPIYPWTLSVNGTRDACASTPSGTPADLSQFVVLIRQPKLCNIDDQILALQGFNAQHILIYTRKPGVPEGFLTETVAVSHGFVESTLGEQWISDIQKGNQIIVDFLPENDSTRHLIQLDNPVSGGRMNYYSYYGPTMEGWIKPQISAPGGSLISTYPTKLGGYAITLGSVHGIPPVDQLKSASRFATPYIAGVMALVMEAKPGKRTPDEWNAMLSTTSTPVNYNDGDQVYDYLDPVLRQGAGVVNAFAAVHATTILDKINLPLNDTVHIQHSQSVTIFNTASFDQTYTFGHRPAPNVYALYADNILDNSTYASVGFQYETVTVPANSKANITIHFDPPGTLNKTQVPIYSGFVTIDGSAGDKLSLPYLGIATSLNNVTILREPSTFFNSSAPGFITNIPSNDTLWKIPQNASNIDPYINALPSFRYVCSWGSRYVNVEIQAQNTDSSSTLEGPILGSLPTYPEFNFAPGEFDIINWDGTLADGTRAPSGKCRFVVRVLKEFGDFTNEQDFEQDQSPWFEISYEGN